jgi:hypothetical protein
MPTFYFGFSDERTPDDQGCECGDATLAQVAGVGSLLSDAAEDPSKLDGRRKHDAAGDQHRNICSYTLSVTRSAS